MNVSFEIAKKADLSEIVRIYNSTIASRMVTADIEEVSVAERQDWFKQHQDPRRPLWVIKSESKIVGWISLGDFYGRAAYQSTVEISVYLDPDFRGQRLGSKSIQFAEQAARRLELKTILGYIFAHNSPSIGLFKSMGYQEWGLLPKIAEMDGRTYDLMILGKKL